MCSTFWPEMDSSSSVLPISYRRLQLVLLLCTSPSSSSSFVIFFLLPHYCPLLTPIHASSCPATVDSRNGPGMHIIHPCRNASSNFLCCLYVHCWDTDHDVALLAVGVLSYFCINFLTLMDLFTVEIVGSHSICVELST